MQSAIAQTSDSTTVGGKSITGVRIVRDNVPQAFTSTTSSTWTDFPGAQTPITVPSSTRAIILVRFTAESACSGNDSGYCNLRVLVNGTEAQPASGDLFAWDDSNGSNVPNHQSHAMDRSIGPLEPGTYTVKLQWKTNPAGSGLTFYLDDWSMTVEKIKV